MRCTDPDVRKSTLAQTLKVAPFWDPIWVGADKRNDPDSVLEARSELWHIDRVTHDVTAVDGDKANNAASACWVNTSQTVAMEFKFVLPTRLSTAAATQGLLRAYQPARRAAVVAPNRIGGCSVISRKMRRAV
jgi:hypothetical protein